MLIDDICTAFLAQHRASPARLELLEFMLGRATTALGAVEVESLTPQLVGAWQVSMPPATRWQATQALKQATAWAHRWRLIDQDPLIAVLNPRPARREQRAFDHWAELVAVADQLPNQLRLLPIIGAGCGLRPGELLGLSWQDIDLERRELTVRASVWRGELRPSLKTRRSRRAVPLRARVVTELATTRAEAGGGSEGLLFASSSGTPLDLHNLRRRMWQPAQKRAGIAPARRLYDLRHTYATWSLRAGVSIFQLARRMGTSVDMIDQTYGHLAADAGAHERAMLDAWDGA